MPVSSPSPGVYAFSNLGPRHTWRDYVFFSECHRHLLDHFLDPVSLPGDVFFLLRLLTLLSQPICRHDQAAKFGQYTRGAKSNGVIPYILCGSHLEEWLNTNNFMTIN